jgi:simple sugar transport system permease protein
MDFLLSTIVIGESTLRVAAPLIFAALGGIFCERSGVVDIGLEGKMLGSAFAAAAVAAATGSAWAGLAAAIGVSLCLALVHAYACVTHHGDQVVSGMALNIVVAGLTLVVGNAWFQRGGQTPALSGDARFDTTGMVVLSLLAVPLAAWILNRTRFGLRLRATGENPGAVDTAGISVAGVRYRAILIGGAFCGLSGAYLAIAHNAGFVRDMSAGKGYLALAALIFGKWRPLPTLLACLLFAFTDAIQVRLQGTALPIVGVIPVQFIQALPYVLTVLLLAGFVGRAVAPKAIGLPYVKER